MNTKTKNIAPQYQWLVALALVFCFSTSIQAEVEDSLADFYGDEDFISIATGSKQLIYQAPSTASVITAKDIKQMGATDIDEVLESVPGLHVSFSSTGNLPLYIFRGINGSFNPQVLMLINGIAITNLLAGDRSQMWGGDAGSGYLAY
ncbi:MAG: TonB-dependent receptor plug domain-containing protein [Enterobacterales bacterium]|nr:TonB-dependent receptor plug domain-containing protein [Enterobacterales bacterium]